MRRVSRRSFVWAGAAVAGAYGAWRWLVGSRDPDGIVSPFRRVLGFNERVWTSAFSPDRLVPTYDLSRVDPERENGDVGIGGDDDSSDDTSGDNFDPAKWKLTVAGMHGAKDRDEITIEQIKAMPSTTMTTELFCIEGWSIVQTWKGVLMREFMRRYPPATLSGAAPDLERGREDLVPYVGMETPDGAYYVGLDMPSAIHAQTMLCYEMNGKPLTLDHGAPLRLVIPVKYGVKNIKRIGTIRYTKARPRDYWAEQGYDWYAGL